jgi:hypothetical protein
MAHPTFQSFMKVLRPVLGMGIFTCSDTDFAF